MEDMEKDSRFAHVGKDPRFRHMKRKNRKFKVDKRFHAMFKDKQFKVKYSVDKRGRPVNVSSNDHLKRFYDLSDSDESSDEDEDPSSSKQKEKSDKESHRDLVGTNLKKGKKPKSTLDTVHIKGPSKNMSKKRDKDKHGSIVKSGSNNSNKQSPSSRMDKQKGKPDVNEGIDDSGESTSGIGEDEDSDDSGEDSTEDEEQLSHSKSEDDNNNEEEEESEEDSTSESEDNIGGPDLARGVGVQSSSEDDLDDSEVEEDEDDSIDHRWGELTQEAEEAKEITRRLAVCNMDWDRIKATDLLVLFNSFKPTGGVIHSVKIYPSEFGLQRLKEEDLKGPKELTEQSTEKKGKGTSSHGGDYHMEKLRQYQLNRMRYYYAVIDCDSVQTADHIYNECDGMEYETSSTKIDLRFIPDNMTFDQEPKSVASDLPQLSVYKPSQFVNTALNQTKVELTWDETDRDRVALTMRKFTKDDIDSMDVKAYLASSSEEEDDPYAGIEEPDFGLSPSSKDGDPGKDEAENEEDVLEKYKQLISETRQAQEEKDEKDTELEITWEPGLKEETEKLVKKASHTDDLTPWESYLQKRKLKQRKKRIEKKKSHQDGDSSAEEEAAISDDELPEGIDLDDPYFKEELDKQKKSSSKESTKKKKRKGKDAALTADGEEARKAEEAKLRLLMMDEDDNRQHFSLEAIMEREKQEKKKKRKRKIKKKEEEPEVEDTFKLNVEDPRFTDLYKNPLYNIDPTAKEFKRTKGSEALIQEKFKRRRKQQKHKASDDATGQSASKVARTDTIDKPMAPAKDTSLASLVKSVKSKAKLHQTKRTKPK